MAIGGAAALPVICASPSFAASPELPVVTYPHHSGAIYPPASAPSPLLSGSFVEPLNASVDCGLRRGAA